MYRPNGPRRPRRGTPARRPASIGATAVLCLALAGASLTGCSGDAQPTANTATSGAVLPTGPATSDTSSPGGATTGGATTGGATTGGTGSGSPSGSSSGTPDPSATNPAINVGSLMTQAMANARAAKSVRVIGRLLVGGRSSAVQAEGQPNGPNQRLIMSGRQWGTFEARAVKGVWYLKGDKAFYVSSKNPNAATLAGKWVRMTSAQAASMRGSTVGGLLNVLLGNKDLLSLTEADLPAQIISYQGRGAYSIGRQLTNDGSEIIVSGVPPIQFRELRSGTKENVRLLFSHWNAVPAVLAPPADAIITP